MIINTNIGTSNTSSAKNGTTFIPSISEDGVLSWTNDGGLENPVPVNLVNLVLNNMEQAEDFTYGG